VAIRSKIVLRAAEGVSNQEIAAMVSNAVDHDGQQFDTGSQEDGLRIIKALARAFQAFIAL
jgi:hypothetical protein